MFFRIRICTLYHAAANMHQQPGNDHHHGMLNSRLIAHLPLIVPEGCAMRVGNETRAWRTGDQGNQFEP